MDEESFRLLIETSYRRCFYPDGVARQLHAINCSGNRTRALSRVELPALVIHGGVDPLIRPRRGGDGAGDPGARLKVVPGMGHDLPPAFWPEIVEALNAHAGGPHHHPGPRLRRGASDRRGRIVPANGIEIAYQEIGDPGGHAAAAGHGGACQMIHWDEDSAGCWPSAVRVIRFDNRDIGHSTKLADPPVPGAEMRIGGGTSTGVRLCRDGRGHRRAPRHLGIERAHVVGASMGGMISQIVAIEHPERVARCARSCRRPATPGRPPARRRSPR